MRAARPAPLALASIATLFLIPSAAGAQVPYERLRSAESEPGSWLTYSGNAGHRFSPLSEITPANVARLRPAWVYQVQEPGPVQVTPLVADGVMYITEARSRVAALDLRTGRALWRYEPEIAKDIRLIGFGPTNRGVALLDDRVFVGTLDARLVALDARTGAVRWSATVADNALGYAITSAPLAVDGRVIIGVSGGEAGIRGFIDAYDAKTGARAWRLYTVPAPGEPGHDTWGGDSWKSGGAPAWLTGSYDPVLGLLYWGTGNPAPDWNGDSRPGDNLYSCSLLALDVTTGAIRWHFQFTPHDTHDWDANQVPVLADAVVDGRPRKLVLTANRNGFYYVLDRVTGEFIRGTEFAKQTWARGLDARGRPIVIPGTEPSEQGTLVWPSLQGATNWFSPAFDRARQLFFVPVREMGSRYLKAPVTYEPGKPLMGGGEIVHNPGEAYGAVRALDALTGERRWEHRLLSPLWAGLMATAGGLVFGSTNEGNVFALDLIQRLPQDAIVLPVQTLGELFNVLLRKARRRATRARSAVLSWRDAYPLVETSATVMVSAADLASVHGLGLWDSVVVSAAAEAECRLLLSEDLQEGFTWRGVTVTNPFAPTRHPLLETLLTASDEN